MTIGAAFVVAFVASLLLFTGVSKFKMLLIGHRLIPIALLAGYFLSLSFARQQYAALAIAFEVVVFGLFVGGNTQDIAESIAGEHKKRHYQVLFWLSALFICLISEIMLTRLGVSMVLLFYGSISLACSVFIEFAACHFDQEGSIPKHSQY